MSSNDDDDSTVQPSFSYVGKVGVSIYIPFILFCAFRTYLSLRENSYKIDFKQRFHISMLFYGILDCIYLANIWEVNTVDMTGFAFHEVGLFVNLYAFSEVIQFWQKTLPLNKISSNVMTYMSKLFLSANLIVLLITLISSGKLINRSIINFQYNKSILL